MRRVKICGINDALSFDTAVEAGADWIAFNLYPRSPRFVSLAKAAELSRRQEGGPARVALLVEPSDDALAQTLDVVRPDILQLYAPAERVAAIRVRFGVPVWRGVGIRTAEDLPETADGADALLIESKAAPDATRPGGNASRFDWGLLAGWRPGFDWMLAGGLTPANVGEAIRVTDAPAYDVSSGVESAPGVKDPALIRAFIQAVRSG